MAVNGLKIDKVTGTTGAVALVTSATGDLVLESVRVHLSAVGGTGVLTVTVDDNDGAVYDVVLASQDMTSLADYVYIPTNGLNFKAGDKINVNYANAGNKTYGVKVVTRLV